jgi:hypothetical protein
VRAAHITQTGNGRVVSVKLQKCVWVLPIQAGAHELFPVGVPKYSVLFRTVHRIERGAIGNYQDNHGSIGA